MPIKRKIVFGGLALLALACIFIAQGADGTLGIERAVAAATAEVPASENMFTDVIRLASLVITALEFLTFLVFFMLQYLLDPEFILGMTQDKEGGRLMLQNIWIFSRDIMNVLFAVLLVVMGILTVVTNQKEWVANYFKKFIIAVILVNFSWFFPRVILDMANVLTATIYQLPAAIYEKDNEAKCQVTRWRDEKAVLEPCKIFTDFYFFGSCKKILDGESPDKDHPIADFKAYKASVGNLVCYREEEFNNETNTAIGILNGLVTNHGRLGQMSRVLNPDSGAGSGTTTDRLEDFFFFLIHTIFVLALHLMLFLPIIAMFVAFLVRIPIIWLTIAFMPFMFLGFVFGDKMGSFNAMAIFKHFVKAAFLPAAVAVPLAAGFILLNAGTIQLPPEFASQMGVRMGPLLHEVENVWGLLWLLMSFMVIWIGFFTAMSIDSIYEKATSGIRSFGQSIGNFAVKSPLSLPIIPIPKSDGSSFQSVLSLKQQMRGLEHQIESGGSLIDIVRGKGKDGKSGDLARELNNPSSNIVKTLEAIKNRLNPAGYTEAEFTTAAGKDATLSSEVAKLNTTIPDLLQAAKLSTATEVKTIMTFKPEPPSPAPKTP